MNTDRFFTKDELKVLLSVIKNYDVFYIIKRFIIYCIILLLPGNCFSSCIYNDSQLKLNHKYYIFVKNIPHIRGGMREGKLMNKHNKKYIFEITNENEDNGQHIKISRENILGEHI